MASRFTLLVTTLGLLSSISGAPLDTIPPTFVQPPAGISLQVLSINSGNVHVNASAAFRDDGGTLDINYTTFNAHTETSVNFYQDHTTTVVLEVAYPAGYSFYVHDPEFDGQITLESRGAAHFFSSAYFGTIVSDTEDIDQVNLTTPFTGDYEVVARSNSTRMQHAPCGGGSANLTLTTRLLALGGILTVNNLFPATVNINHESTSYQVAWTSC